MELLWLGYMLRLGPQKICFWMRRKWQEGCSQLWAVSSCVQPIILGFNFFCCPICWGFEVQFEVSILRFFMFSKKNRFRLKVIVLGCLLFFYNWFKAEGIGDWFLDLLNSFEGLSCAFLARMNVASTPWNWAFFLGHFTLYFEAGVIDSFGYPRVILSKEVGSDIYLFCSCFQSKNKILFHSCLVLSYSTSWNIYFILVCYQLLGICILSFFLFLLHLDFEVPLHLNRDESGMIFFCNMNIIFVFCTMWQSILCYYMELLYLLITCHHL